MNARAWSYAHCAPENLIKKKKRNDFYPFLSMKWTNARFLRTQSACAIIIHANRFSWANICFWITWRLLQTSRNVNICFLSYNTDQVSKMYLLFQKKCQNSSSRSRKIELKLRWRCWPPLPWGGLGGVKFFLNIFWSMYRTFIIFFPAQRKTLKTPSTYFENDHDANRKFFRAFR